MSIVKKLTIILLPSIFLIAIYFLVIKEDSLVEVEEVRDKITILLVTNDMCEDCGKQEEIFMKVDEETDEEFFVFDTLNMNSPMYKDVAEILNVHSYPTIASLAPSGELLYSRSGLHNESQIQQVKSTSLESFAELVELRRDYEDRDVEQIENEEVDLDE